METDRERRMRREKGQGVVRALHQSELEAAGTARANALREADEQLDRIARLLPDALAAGLSISEIARLTGLSRPTVYELRSRYSNSERDLSLAVLQTLMSFGFSDDVAAHLGRTQAEIRPIIHGFMDRGWVDWDLENRQVRRDVGDVIVSDEELETPYYVTMEGYQALEAWRFNEDNAREHQSEDQS
jgi:DNA-binding phage protein